MIISFLRLLFSKTFFFGFVFCFKWSYDPRSYGCNCSNNCIEKPEKVKATMWVWIYDLVMVVGHSNQLSQQIVGGGHLWVQNNVPIMNESMDEMIYMILTVMNACIGSFHTAVYQFVYWFIHCWSISTNRWSPPTISCIIAQLVKMPHQPNARSKVLIPLKPWIFQASLFFFVLMS